MNFINITKNLVKKNKNVCALIHYIIYYFNRFIIQRKFKNVYLNNYVKFVKLDLPKKKNTFFGYYNISPFNINGDMLFCMTNSDSIRNCGKNLLEIYIYKFNKGYNFLTSTNSWNWQQGCMLQWINNKDTIIFNKFSNENNEYYSEIRNINTGKCRNIDKPIYSVSKNGDFALSLDFSRLASLRSDYGYFNKKVSENIDNIDSAIWFIDILDNRISPILNFQDIIDFEYSDRFSDSIHWVNHIDISPDNSRFMFLHRWRSNNNDKTVRHTRLLTANINGKDLYCLADDEMVSHCSWKDSKHIVSFCRKKAFGDRYYLLEDKTNNFNIFKHKKLKQDGHPSFLPYSDWLLTDTYPDKSRMSEIILYNIKNNKLYIIGKFFQPLKNIGECRCDLHPRCDRTGRYISFDSCHDRKRGFYILDICNLVD